MWLSRFFPVILFFINLLERVKSSPLLAERATPKCTARNIEIVRRTVDDEVYFCKWWLSDGRTRSPFFEFTPTAVTKLCNCIISDTKTVSKQKRTEAATVENLLEKRQTQASCRAEVSRQFTEPWYFCTFYNSYPRTTSPFAKYSAKALIDLCKCVEGKVVTSSGKKTGSSTRKTSASTKKLSSSTIKKVSSSTKKESTTKKISSSIKKVSSSTKKVSSSTKNTTSSNKKSPTASKKASSSTLKASIVSTKPSSSTKKVSSTTRKASSSSKTPSSTVKKASTSTKRLSSSPKSVLLTTKKTSNIDDYYEKFFAREQIDINCQDISQILDFNQIISKVFVESVVSKVTGVF
ncbi:hypothetical protein AUEXF2481DRAFT_5123 [Aureobasidium subglaciale EXF-2481]|uniref:Ig-like domain-containing protein n=1 Tax=Aureobasidium subglaciale (strain EXF-2481) TaxID=1043005 RepID=A0A074YCK6_AURSE|nr:uncharacterized protein AUEXF2481DRAFT_5123 [Aureobasidium subglaciale EXF-2481]KEQ95523.1 hypothetical protein AUEXF2481DRAFT_5123 [Aureobasidium subglaciale EXF-2481]